MDPGLAIALGGLVVSGGLMGHLTSWVGLPMKVELPIWMVLYAAWAVVAGVDAWSEFGLFVAASALGGIATGMSQALMFERYRSNNPWYEDKMPADQKAAWKAFVPFATAMGAFWGLAFAGISWGISALFA